MERLMVGAMRPLLTGSAAVVTALGWSQLAPAFGAPVTAPAGMLDRLLGADREAGPFGWVLLSLGEAAFVGFYFLVVERRARGALGPLAFALVAWLITGAVVMPVVGLVQGPPPPGTAANDPMRASFFMLDLGPGAAAVALVGWVLQGAVLGAGRELRVGSRAFILAAGAAILAAAGALALPGFDEAAGPGARVEGRVAALPTGPVFVSVLELPQPPGAVLGPHQHVAGFVMDVSGVATVGISGQLIDVGPGSAYFTPDGVLHDHRNRAAIPFAIALAVLLVGTTVGLLVYRGRSVAIALMAALLVSGTIATIDPLMDHWYFIAVRPAAARGAAMPVPAGHRTYESDALTGLASGPQQERLTDQRLVPGISARFAGPAAIVVLRGDASLMVEGRKSDLRARAGATVAGGTDATVQSGSSGARILVFQVFGTP
jgi:quercetin dioxygenase-like cupin family protein